ncbi:hypothetical protein COL516b_001787 [Colletotrichum fioriniae]|nr:uncharacterized protein COL516b_001787 [Colletotrichum fioriniae]KAJ0311084.1 hypothetical protein COL516b_001787 [Colletotrichum fioriniae]
MGNRDSDVGNNSTIYNAGPSAVVQVMLGPIFKQYRLMDLSDGYVVALTQSGDIKRGISVIDQSNLWSRLNAAFDSGKGSVRVLVLYDRGIELVVDVKVVHTSRRDAERAAADKPPTLTKLARDGDVDRVLTALESGADIDECDENGKTAIFYAIEKKQRKLIGELLDRPNDLAIVDKYGKTALDYAVRIAEDNSLLDWVPDLLMKKGASPMNGIDPQTLNLLVASGTGTVAIVQDILKKFDSATRKSKLSGRDRLGYTALHEAAYFGRYDIVEELIKSGADPDATTIMGNDSVLHTVVERREHRSYLGNDRGDSVSLIKDHARITELLLNYVKPSLVEKRRASDRKTLREVVVEKLQRATLSMEELATLQKILVILKGYLNGGTTTLNEQDAIRSTDIFRAIRVEDPRDPYHDQLTKIQVYGFGFNGDSKKVFSDSLETFLLETPRMISNGSHWTWMHLPKNNKIWVKV